MFVCTEKKVIRAVSIIQMLARSIRGLVLFPVYASLSVSLLRTRERALSVCLCV